MIQALVFDFDGLILDTETPDYRSWQDIYAAHGVTLEMDAWADCIGREANVFDPCEHLERLLNRQLDRIELWERRRQRFTELMDAQPLQPGVLAYIHEAKELGLKLAVASSAPREWVTRHLTRFAILDQFDCIKCVEDAPRAKPDPALYVAAIQALGVHPSEAIAFEDSPHGTLAAKQAGLFCVAVPNPVTCQLNHVHADLELGSLSELPLGELLKQISEMRTA